MEFNEEEALLFLESLHVPQEVETRCRNLMGQGNYQETCRCLKSLRCEYLENLHESQKRLDQLDYLLFVLKKRNAREVRSNESDRNQHQC